MRKHTDGKDEYAANEQAAAQMEPDRLILIVGDGGPNRVGNCDNSPND